MLDFIFVTSLIEYNILWEYYAFVVSLSSDTLITAYDNLYYILCNILRNAFVSFHHMLKIDIRKIFLPDRTTKYKELLGDILKLGEDGVVCE